MWFWKNFIRLFCELLINKYQIVFIFLVIVIVFCLSHVGEVRKQYQVILNSNERRENNYYKLCNEKIDVVYTWVNGSDEIFKNNLKKYSNEDSYNVNDFSEARFDDKYELKFSLRSLEKYAPWINHVYIVTNGQIPYWLNLDYEKVSIITHEQIFSNLNYLPTFSSPSIESNLHRIPGLSKYFIYLNDDIFLGAPIYPDDFFSPNRGFLIYLAWPLPSCVPNCPWVYVGDGQCDSSCFNTDCQFDGGDCENSENRVNSHDLSHHDFDDDVEYDYYDEHHFAKRNIPQINQKQPPTITTTTKSPNPTKIKNDTKIFLGFVQITNELTQNDKTQSNNTNNRASFFGNKLSLFRNNTNHSKLFDFIKEHNQKVLHYDKIKRKKRLFKTLRKRKMYYKSVFNNTTQNATQNGNKRNLDTYALSLQHTNRVFNIKYGFKMRKVPAHAPILINKDIMDSLQEKFWKEIQETQKNRFRSSNDMQFSFTYYYYLINEKIDNNISDIFDRFDTDRSGSWSDREIRTILTKINELPLSYGMVEIFDNAIINCSKHFKKTDEFIVPAYERYIDSKLPTVTKELILNCPEIIKMLKTHFQIKDKYLFEIIKNSQGQYVQFKMLTSNISDVVGHLDEIRKHPRKFICLNDNMDPKKTEENDLIKAILLDFYISLFPKPSKYELSQEYRNRFSHISDLENWKTYHTKLKIFLLFCVLLLLLFCFYNICKRRFLKQVKRILYF